MSEKIEEISLKALFKHLWTIEIILTCILSIIIIYGIGSIMPNASAQYTMNSNNNILSPNPNAIGGYEQKSTNDINTVNWINRSLDTTYHNNDTNRALFIYGSVSIVTGDNDADKAYVQCKTYDDLNSPVRMESGQYTAFNLLGQDFSFDNEFYPFACVVAPNQDYALLSVKNNGTVSLDVWNEVYWS